MGAKKKLTVRRKTYVNKVIKELWAQHKAYVLQQNELSIMEQKIFQGKTSWFRLLVSTDSGKTYIEKYSKVSKEFCEGYIQAIHDSHAPIFVQVRLISSGDKLILEYPIQA